MSAEPTLRDTPSDGVNGQTIVQQMLEIYNSRLPVLNHKSLTWVNKLECLTVKPGPKPVLQREIIPCPKEAFPRKRNYVAVSYSWEPMEVEGVEAREKPIHKIFDSRSVSPKQSDTRDSIIARTIQFANHVGCPHFWIAQDCINQKVLKAQSTAMDSMDLVYKEAKFSIGLLSIPLSNEKDMEALHTLLFGRLVPDESDDEASDYSMTIEDELQEISTNESDDGFSDDDSMVGGDELQAIESAESMKSIVDLLWRFRGDRWWSRQWIFQEEYLAGMDMYLLLRHSSELEGFKRNLFPRAKRYRLRRERRYRPAVILIDEELCIQATHFRQQATLLLNSVLHDPDEELKHLHEKCRDLLKDFGKYNVLYDLDDDHHGRPMSARIFSDLERRGVTNPFDLLPVAANSCNYAIRFDSKQLVNSRHSLELYALVMYILNGEIINDKAPLPDLSPGSLAQVFRSVSFSAFDPPVGVKQLTWLKNCRLARPVLTLQGMKTRGYLWKACHVLNTSSWKLPRRRHHKISDHDLGEEQLSYLVLLRNELKRNERCASLVRKLWKCICKADKARSLPKNRRPAKRYMNVMASEVAEAIRCGKSLYLAGLGHSDEPSAIFVGLEDEDAWIFTSWSHKVEEDRRERTRHVSLQVEVSQQDSTSDLPLMRVVSWINGLLFFEGESPLHVIFRWSDAWTQQA